MLRQLLVPLDGSSAAEQALPVARRLAQATQATVHLVRVIPAPPLPWAAMGTYLPQSADDLALQADERAALAALAAARARLTAGGISVSTASLLGEAAPQLQFYERAQRIDLVVLGLHHHAGPARLTLWPVASYLLRHGSAPLLLVGGFADPACLAHAVVPLDGSAEHEAVLGTLLTLVPSVVQRVSLLRVVQDEAQRSAGESYLAEIAERLARQGLKVVERRVVVGCPEVAIGELASTEQLVVMATHAHSSPLHWLPSSVAERVVHQQIAAVLLLRTGTRAGTRLHTVQGGLGHEHKCAAGTDAPTALEG